MLTTWDPDDEPTALLPIEERPGMEPNPDDEVTLEQCQRTGMPVETCHCWQCVERREKEETHGDE